ncbi:MAG: hypothetical protein ACREVY_18140 [Gammaproteobacteria bacterium]
MGRTQLRTIRAAAWVIERLKNRHRAGIERSRINRVDVSLQLARVAFGRTLRDHAFSRADHPNEDLALIVIDGERPDIEIWVKDRSAVGVSLITWVFFYVGALVRLWGDEAGIGRS